ncbi:glycosyltransferase involved in cell wall biosynthesis [Sphingobium sp. B11D3B]|uniref:glycosyltransferase n=1 Tax=Sphingobium sp. B11D3B TaxID=2940575 RepID=UPI0022260CC1|nr:glycosyltransferase [Sphingobium sp. B11D3B]MCW2387629.1 glycosyltransferase involved in cell wall biosynthesis [Sphingobium sp. B11D3B]
MLHYFDSFLARRLGPTDDVQAKNSKTRRIFLDVSAIKAHDAQTGIQRVVRALVANIQCVAESNLQICTVYATVNGPYRLTNYFLSAEVFDRSVPEDVELELGAGDIFLALDLCAHILPLHERQFVEWQRRGAVIAAVVYDLLPYSNPEWFSKKACKNFRRWLGLIGRRADILLPISEQVSNKVRDYMQRRHPDRAGFIKCEVLPLSGDIRASRPTMGITKQERVLLKSLRDCPYVMAVGTVEPRKAHSKILEAHRHLRASRAQNCPFLIVVGKPGWKSKDTQRALEELSLEKDGALWLPAASDELLDLLYRNCVGLIAASFDEGYCLPVAEALAYHKPVLARDIPIFREFDDILIRYFQRDDPVSLSLEIERMASLLPTPSISVLKGWDMSAEALLAAVVRR